MSKVGTRPATVRWAWWLALACTIACSAAPPPGATAGLPDSAPDAGQVDADLTDFSADAGVLDQGAVADLATAPSPDAAADAPETSQLAEIATGICQGDSDCFWLAVQVCEHAACVGGDCVAAPLDCDDKNECSADSCDAVLGCVHQATFSACDDGDPCTVGDACNSLFECVPGASPCPPQTCHDVKCAPKAGSGGYDCQVQNKANGTPCAGDPCWSGDFCNGGKCIPGPLPQCDDGNACTVDTCAGKGVCQHSVAQAGSSYAPGSGLPLLACLSASDCNSATGPAPLEVAGLCGGLCSAGASLPAGWQFVSSVAGVNLGMTPWPDAPTGPSCGWRVAGTQDLCAAVGGVCPALTVELRGPAVDFGQAAAPVAALSQLHYTLSTGLSEAPYILLQWVDAASGAVLASEQLVASAGTASVPLVAKPGLVAQPRLTLQLGAQPLPAKPGSGLWLTDWTVRLQLAPEQCDNGKDDNGDGHVDCKDALCQWSWLCKEKCADGLDNDQDDAVDCADTDCQAVPECGKLLWSDTFACGDQQWTMLPAGPSPTTAAWSIGQPSGGIVPPTGNCALQFNNGTDFLTYKGPSWGAASLSKPITVPSGAKLRISFKAYLAIENEPNYDILQVQVSNQAFADCPLPVQPLAPQCLLEGTAPHVKVLKSSAFLDKWFTYSAEFSLPGDVVWLRLAFDSIDQTANNGLGIFVDDLEVRLLP